MSSEFVQFKFPCKECLVRASCKPLPEDTLERIPEHTIACLAVPTLKSNDKITWQKFIFECIANILKDWSDHTSKSNERGTQPQAQIPYEYYQVIVQLSRIFQYMVNSTSWRTTKLEYFDQYELSSKLKTLEYLLAHDKTRGWDTTSRKNSDADKKKHF